MLRSPTKLLGCIDVERRNIPPDKHQWPEGGWSCRKRHVGPSRRSRPTCFAAPDNFVGVYLAIRQLSAAGYRERGPRRPSPNKRTHQSPSILKNISLMYGCHCPRCFHFG